jgi:hypothetical protein
MSADREMRKSAGRVATMMINTTAIAAQSDENVGEHDEPSSDWSTKFSMQISLAKWKHKNRTVKFAFCRRLRIRYNAC